MQRSGFAGSIPRITLEWRKESNRSDLLDIPVFTAVSSASMDYQLKDIRILIRVELFILIHSQE
jgi:hypothetical protein